jgi:hypothetical protein
MAIIQPKLVAIDSSVLAEWAADASSPQAETGRAARQLLESLITSDWVPVLTWHHFEELVRHPEEQLVAYRMAFLGSLRHVAWIKSSAGPAHLGSIVDLIAAEVDAILSAPGVAEAPPREAVRESLVRYGSPSELETVNLWRDARPLLQSRQIRTREIASVAHTETMQALQARVLELTDMQALDDPSAEILFREQATELARVLAQRGDRRLRDYVKVADIFTETVAQAFRNIRDSGDSPLSAFLREFDVPREDVTENMTLDEFADVAARRRVLRIVCRSRGLDLDHVWPRLRHVHLPSLWVQEEIRRARKTAPRASGSDLADSYLAAFSPYLDAVVVDRRTHEYLSQSCRRKRDFERRVGRFLRVSSYRSLVQELQRESV